MAAFDLNFKKLDERGVKPLLDFLKRRKKLKIQSVDAPNRIRREMGYAVKRVVVNLMDGQRLELKMKPDDAYGLVIFQVRLNGKVFPVKNEDDIEAAVGEVVGVIRAQSDRYANLQAKKTERLKSGDGGTGADGAGKAGVKSAAAKLAEANAAAEDAKAAVDELRGQVEVLEGEVGEKTGRLDAVKADIETERTRNAELRGELEELREAA